MSVREATHQTLSLKIIVQPLHIKKIFPLKRSEIHATYFGFIRFILKQLQLSLICNFNYTHAPSEWVEFASYARSKWNGHRAPFSYIRGQCSLEMSKSSCCKRMLVCCKLFTKIISNEEGQEKSWVSVLHWWSRNSQWQVVWAIRLKNVSHFCFPPIRTQQQKSS